MSESMYDQVTLYGFYNVYPEVLTGLDLPEGLDEEMARFTILDNAGMLFPYHQAMPYLSTAIHNWFKQNKDNFARIMAALAVEYDPIENYDRKEDRTVTNEMEAESNTNTTTSSDSTSQRAADNSESFRNVDKSIGGASSDGTSGTSSKGTTIESLRVHGNIGVTTNQQMVQAELDLRKFNIYEHICDRFVDKFLMGVYD